MSVVAEVIRQRSRALNDLHTGWALRQVTVGVDGTTPEGSPDPSDYNQHVPDLESSGQAEDRFHTQAQAIMGLGDTE
jgi:hypothetical protein